MLLAFFRRIAACALLFPSLLFSTVYNTSSTPINEIFDNLKPGDAVNFDDGDIAIVGVTKPISGVQFIGGRARWVLDADIENCDFLYHAVVSLKQREGKLRKSSFLVTHYGFGNLELTHTDSVCFYFCETWQLPGNSPRMQLNGFVRNVLWHKSFTEPKAGEDVFNSGFAPVLRICAWDPVGNGHGTYITSPIIWDGRGDTFFHVVRGSGITFAHCNTEYNRWSSPIANFDNVSNCALLCNGVGAANDAANEGYKTQADVIQYAGYKQLGHYNNMVPFRGAAFRMGGINNRSIASGSYKTWSIGIKAWLPCLHYDDAITIRDPWFEDWCWQRGTSTVSFSKLKSQFLFGAGEVSQYGEARYPIDGANIIAPYFRRLPKNILARRRLGKTLGPDRIAMIKSLLRAGKTVHLGKGEYVFDETLRDGEIIGEGPDRTVVRFLGKKACATGRFRGYSNCTVSGGSWGFVNDAYAIQSSFIRTVFRDNSEGGILIDDNSQNDCIQDAEFYGGKYGIKTGHNSNTKDPNIDKLDIINCHFEGQSVKGIELFTDPQKVKNGQVAVLGCSFKDIGGAAVHINGTQTHMVQGCTVENVCTDITERAAVTVESYKSDGAVAISHVTISGSNPAATGISFGGNGAISHCAVNGMGTAVRVIGRSAVVDHITSPDGNLEVADGASVYLARSKMANAECGITDSKVRIYSGTSFQEQQGSVVSVNSAPPAAVTDVNVERKTNDPDYPYLKDYNLVTWEPVPDPGSTIIGYAVFANGQEIGRTRAWRANGHGHTLRGDRTDAPSAGAPADYELVRTEFRDPNVNNSNYAVKPINGAHLFPDGSVAPERKWTQPWGYFMTPDGKEFRVDKLEYVNSDTRWVEDTTRGLRVNAREEGKLVATVAPTYITHDWGDFSMHAGSGVPSRIANSVHKAQQGNAPTLSGNTLHIPSPMHAAVTLLDLRGRCITTLAQGALRAGSHTFPIPRGRVSAGTYIITVQTNRHALSQKLLVQ